MPKGSLQLWHGLMTDGKDFLHLQVEANAEGKCNGVPIRTVAWNYTAQAGPVAGSSAVNIRYRLDEQTGNWTQSATQNGKTLTTLNAGQGKGYEFYFASECHDCGPMTVGARSYIDTTIILDTPIKEWTPAPESNGVNYGSFNTVDNGKTWHLDWLHFPECHFDKANTLEIPRRS
ncbi:hypothetical protein EJ08DRAFT_735901 [Tothia fuscella]|uniref:Uncharacterized protein n=1 Tax=Tothia fuscella TaxID=1048955 RepID=A0A9P4TWV1_9PEZI|nr:hypothetical protein EJ08DRAFT_735901 [Tothia fuscella]